MSARIPVGRTISDAYTFGFARFLSVLGIVWFPYACLAALAMGAFYLLAPGVPRLLLQGDFDFSMLAGLRRVGLVLWLAGLVVSAMVAVGLQRRALGEMTGPVFIWFSLAAPVWRMVAAFFLAWVIIVVIAILAAIACGLIWLASGHLPYGVTVAIRAIAILAAACFVIFVAVRLCFFLPPVVVSERLIGLERAWLLSRGNFWRIVGVGAAIFIPVGIAFSLIASVLFGSFAIPHLTAAMSLKDILREIALQFRVVGPYMLAYRFVERIVFFGLGNGANASAYLAVGGKTPAGRVSDGA
ncbi:MAG TPA: hypothetical protein VGF97_12225 [Rhizomicrobium sp.]|jgi:hypothetical protein